MEWDAAGGDQGKRGGWPHHYKAVCSTILSYLRWDALERPPFLTGPAVFPAGKIALKVDSEKQFLSLSHILVSLPPPQGSLWWELLHPEMS